MDPSRVGGPENPLLGGSDLTTMIGPGRGGHKTKFYTLIIYAVCLMVI